MTGSLGMILFGVLLAASPAAGHEASIERPELAFGRSAEFDYDPPEPGSYRLPPLKQAGDGAVVDEAGRQRRLGDLTEGRITVLSFIYTECSDARGCPLASAVLAQLHMLLSEDAVLGKRTRLVSLSFDPGHDAPKVMARYAEALRGPAGEGAEWLFLTTKDEDALQPILDAYGQRIVRVQDTPDGFSQISHQLRVYLIDSKARIRNIYSTGFLDPRLVMTDLRTLLMEEAAGGF